MQLMLLPDLVLDKIFSFLTYDEVAKYRIVSRAWNESCQDTLNRGFVAVEKYHLQCYKKYKALLPRRESERRTHEMARHCEILTAIETRISLLTMTYTKYIDAKLCCFIPGKVTDEIFRVLNALKDMDHPPRAHEVLQELRDISSMAMEHFDENIAPGLRDTAKKMTCSEHIPAGTTIHRLGLSARNCHLESSSTVPMAPCSVQPADHCTSALCKLRTELVKQAADARKTKKSLTDLRTSFKTFVRKANTERVQLNRKIQSQDEKIKIQDAQLVEMKQQLVEWEHKFNDIIAKLSKVPGKAKKDIAANLSRVLNKAEKEPVPNRSINAISVTVAGIQNTGRLKKTVVRKAETARPGLKRTRSATKAKQSGIKQKRPRLA